MRMILLLSRAGERPKTTKKSVMLNSERLWMIHSVLSAQFKCYNGSNILQKEEMVNTQSLITDTKRSGERLRLTVLVTTTHLKIIILLMSGLSIQTLLKRQMSCLVNSDWDQSKLLDLVDTKLITHGMTKAQMLSNGLPKKWRSITSSPCKKSVNISFLQLITRTSNKIILANIELSSSLPSAVILMSLLSKLKTRKNVGLLESGTLTGRMFHSVSLQMLRLIKLGAPLISVTSACA